MTTDSPTSGPAPVGTCAPDAVTDIRELTELLAAVLPGGYDSVTFARDSVVPIAESYAVVALRLPSTRETTSGSASSRGDTRRAMSRIRTALAASRAPGTSLLLGPPGGIVLTPSPASGNEKLDELLDRLSAAAQAKLIATCTTAPPLGIPDAAVEAGDLLALASRLHYPPKLYRLGDLALEYQLTRPTPGRRVLCDALNPLDTHPALIQTLLVHIGNDLNRRRTARELRVHVHTIDYRLKRIGELTGLDPCSSHDLWYLRSAVVVRRGAANDDRWVRHAVTGADIG